jgi:hypothetical protein
MLSLVHPIALGFVVVVSVAVVTRGPAASGPTLVVGADGSASGAMTSVHANKYRTAYFSDVCVSGPGKITIRFIKPVKPRGGLAVTDFSVVPTKDDNTAILGGSNKRLREEPSYRGLKTVAASCASQHHADLFVEIYKPRTDDAGADEFAIDYVSDGDHRSTKVRFGFQLCEKVDCDIVDAEQ